MINTDLDRTIYCENCKRPVDPSRHFEVISWWKLKRNNHKIFLSRKSHNTLFNFNTWTWWMHSALLLETIQANIYQKFWKCFTCYYDIRWIIDNIINLTCIHMRYFYLKLWLFYLKNQKNIVEIKTTTRTRSTNELINIGKPEMRLSNSGHNLIRETGSDEQGPTSCWMKSSQQ